MGAAARGAFGGDNLVSMPPLPTWLPRRPHRCPFRRTGLGLAHECRAGSLRWVGGVKACLIREDDHRVGLD